MHWSAHAWAGPSVEADLCLQRQAGLEEGTAQIQSRNALGSC